MNHFQFPVEGGTLAITWNSQQQISRIDWYTNKLASWTRADLPSQVAEQIDKLRAYFFEGSPIGTPVWGDIDTQGWSDFQLAVYRAISEIPHGETRTYGWVSRRLGRFAAPRAVGQALRKNPIPILIPCHRVVARASLGGFMGSSDPQDPELQLKRRLLELEEGYRNPCFAFLRGLELLRPTQAVL